MMTREELVARYEAMSYPQLAAEFKLINEAKAQLKKEQAAVEMEFDILTKEIIPDKMAEDGFRTLSLADGGRIELRAQAYCSTRAGMKGKLFEWLNEHGFQDLVTEVVNPGTLKAFIKEQQALGNEVPDDEIVNYQPYTRATVVGK